MSVRRLLLLATMLLGVQLVVASNAFAAQPQNAPDPGSISGGQTTAPPVPGSGPKKAQTNGNCSAGALLLNAVNPFSHCNAASQAVNGVGQLPGDAAGAAGAAASGLAGDAMDQVASWMVQAATTIDRDVMNAATSTSTPELSAPWYQQEFGYVAFFGAALAGIVALLGVLSAAVRSDPFALGEIFLGVLRAALLTALVISLTLLALKVADGISADVVQRMPRDFFQTLASAWGAKSWGGFASSALAFIAALVEVFVAVLLWIELLFRDAAIYIAVLFFPVTLAMSIWPALAGAHSKLARILGVFILFKPAALIVMLTGANLLLGGLSFVGGVGPSAGTILAGLAVLSMAAFAPWALLHLTGLDHGPMAPAGASSGSGKAGGAERAAAAGALGGELFAGPVAAGAAPGASGAAIGASGGPSGAQAASRGVAGAASTTAAGAGSGDNGRRILPGPIAAAAGLLPAGWQTAQSTMSRGHLLADHAAARIQTAAGHRATMPASSLGSNATSGSAVTGLYPYIAVPPAPAPSSDIPAGEQPTSSMPAVTGGDPEPGPPPDQSPPPPPAKP